jgi:hypothetical protein
MKITAQAYFVQQNLMDFQLKSTMGFTDDDIAALKNLDYIKDVQPSYSVDAFLKNDNNLDTIIRAYSINTADVNNEDYISKPMLMEGRLPRAQNECVIENNEDLSNSKTKSANKLNFFLILLKGDITILLNAQSLLLWASCARLIILRLKRQKLDWQRQNFKRYVYTTRVFKYEVYTIFFLH